MSVPLLDVSDDHRRLLPRLLSEFEALVSSGRFILGPKVQTMEKQLAAYCQCEAAVGVSSGTDALLLAQMALKIGPGDQVITSPFTFFATGGCIARTGATPIFVDIDPATFNIDPAQIESALTQKTKAIMPVHLFGQSADMPRIMALAQAHGLKVIEDAAQAIGARLGDKSVGSFGDVGCFSFYPTKNLAALGDAGACTTNDLDLAQHLGHLRNHGQDTAYEHHSIGGNFRIDALQAAMLSIKFELLDAQNQMRRQHADRYNAQLQELGLTLPKTAPGAYHVYNQYTVRVHDGQRDALSSALTEQGIGNRVYYPLPLHLQPCFDYLQYKQGQFPRAELACHEVLSLPVFPSMTEAQQDEVISAVRQFFDHG